MSAPVEVTQPPCVCVDPDLDRLRVLISAGWSQRDASLALWSGTGPARVLVWVGLTRAFPWLRVAPPAASGGGA